MWREVSFVLDFLWNEFFELELVFKKNVDKQKEWLIGIEIRHVSYEISVCVYTIRIFTRIPILIVFPIFVQNIYFKVFFVLKNLLSLTKQD